MHDVTVILSSVYILHIVETDKQDAQIAICLLKNDSFAALLSNSS